MRAKRKKYKKNSAALLFNDKNNINKKNLTNVRTVTS